ncbi:MAG: hypothetical protein ACTSVB_08090 [Candidatus Heimdallarchaeaceae archaeon]
MKKGQILVLLILLGNCLIPLGIQSGTIQLTTRAFLIDKIEITDKFAGTTNTQYRIQIGILFVRIYGSSGGTFDNDKEYGDFRTSPKDFDNYIDKEADFSGNELTTLDTDHETDSTYTYPESHSGWELWIFIKVQKKTWLGWTSSETESQKFYLGYSNPFTWTFWFDDYGGELTITMKAIDV